MVISATVLRFPAGSESILAYSLASGAAAGFLADALTRYGFLVQARLGIGLAFGFSVHRFSQIYHRAIQSLSARSTPNLRCVLLLVPLEIYQSKHGLSIANQEDAWT